MQLKHPTPRTIHGGDLSMYIALTGDARPLASSTELARSLGFKREVVPELLGFHVVFGKTVRDISRNAIANLGYADVRFLAPVYPGDTLRAESEVIGVRESSKGESGVVWVRTRGFNQSGTEVLSYCRWVLVNKRDPDRPAPKTVVPELPDSLSVADIPVPDELNLQRWPDLTWTTGSEAGWNDYQVGQVIDHPEGMTIDESDHTLATRLYQNNAAVHFNGHRMASSRFGKRLVYGGHVISVAHSLAFSGLENGLAILAWNSGVHANPTFAGDTLYARSEVVGKEEIPGRSDVGALRVKLFAFKDADPATENIDTEPEGRKYDSRIVLALDYWLALPRS
ncbi:MAG: MaoC family dehydratase [Deltaproteobacteria bacterium]|nr:MaoC family dehydratase [Deltaproteobacteria bacterium]